MFQSSVTDFNFGTETCDTSKYWKRWMVGRWIEQTESLVLCSKSFFSSSIFQIICLQRSRQLWYFHFSFLQRSQLKKWSQNHSLHDSRERRHSKSEQIGGDRFFAPNLAEKVRKLRKQNFLTKVRKSSKCYEFCDNIAHLLRKYDVCTMYIWVSFCRAGILAVSCHFFLKSRAFVWLNLIR